MSNIFQLKISTSRQLSIDRSRSILMTIICTGLLLVMPIATKAQETAPAKAPATSVPMDGLYFADIVVRGQVVFQIGSLSNISASDRAGIINRRIVSFLASEVDRSITVRNDPQRGIATLQLNNRILMTVTQQDAQDFNVGVETLAQQWATALNRAFDEPPLAIDVGQRLYSTIRQFQRDAIDRLPAILGALLIILLTMLLAITTKRITLAASDRWEIDYNSKTLVSRIVSGMIWIFGSIVALSVLGMDFTALVGTLGVTSVAIGFSLRDILSNYFSGIILLVARPFQVGDQIIIQDFEGTVNYIQLRATTLVTYDGRMISIPNQQVFTATIINNTASEFRRSSLTIGINYDTDIGQVKEIIHQAALTVESIVADPPLEILVRELAAGAVKIEVRFWVSSRRLSFLESTSQVAQSIKEAIKAAGIDLPNEIYTVQFKDPPQIFDPAAQQYQRDRLPPT
ncbi:mechanosensitive ion channel family protein [Chamaesiphon sp. OTE_20_metabat_361]|uniref:mechanosensitive ion channel family protein n=1 Tax=Chamaesiphon sp. OTE_20_metabat_361 TaxID=2964689 RepID=UPI002869FF97|nr:mechanosensitive ion channel family protein [Chamaesiphon sp. OTE_20_metabat_361]